MRKYLALFGALLVFASSASAGGHKDATLSLVSFDGQTAQLAATFTGNKNVNRYDLWVACHSYDADGVVLSASYQGVTWDGDSGSASCELTPGAASDDAYVWKFPDAWTPDSNTVTFF